MADKAVERAAELLAAAGFAVDTKSKRKSGGVDVALVATDPRRPRVAGRRGRRVHDRPPGPAAHRRAGAHAGAGRPPVRLRGPPPAGAGHRRAGRRSAGAERWPSARGRLFVDVLPVDAGGGGGVERLRAYARAGAADPIGDLITAGG